MSQLRPCSFSHEFLNIRSLLFPNLLMKIYNYLYLRVVILKKILPKYVWCFRNEKLKAGIIDLHCVIILKIKRRMLTHKSRLFLIFPSHNPSANNGREERKSWRWMQTNINRHCLCLSLIFFDYNISLFNHGTMSLPKKQCNFIRMLTTTAVFHFFRDLKSSLSKSA